MKINYRHKYAQHKRGAAERGIPFTLTYAEWLQVWGDKIEQRGVHADQLGMLRTRDEGGYELGNVRLGTPKENRQEWAVGHKVRKAVNGAAYFRTGKAQEFDNAASWLGGRNHAFDEYVEDEEEIA